MCCVNTLMQCPRYHSNMQCLNQIIMPFPFTFFYITQMVIDTHITSMEKIKWIIPDRVTRSETGREREGNTVSGQ